MRPDKKHIINRWLVLAVMLVFSAALMAGCGSADSISGSVSVLGTELTDLSRDELHDAIAGVIEKNPIDESVTVRFLGSEYEVKLADISASYDVDAMTDAALSAGQKGLFEKLFGSDDIPEITPAVTYDENALRQQADKAAEALSRGDTEFSYEIGDTEVTVTKGCAAQTLKSDDVLKELETRLSDMDYSDIEMPGELSHADIDFDALKSEIDRPAGNPRLDLENDPTGGTVLEGQRGITMDVEIAKKALEASGDDDTFSFPVVFTEPTMTVRDFRSKLFRDTLSTISSSFNPGLKGRTTNVKLACDFCNNVILNPGDEFSYNKSVGPRTYERGFKDATVYVAGTTEEGVGGGICQVSSTIYSAALHADLKITERYNHSYMITYVPLGEDATVVYGSKDFRFVNNTDYPIKLRVTYGKSTMTVSIIGTNVNNKTVEISTKRLSSTPFQVVYKTDTSLPVDTTKVKNNGYTGYVTESYRLVYENGKLVSNTFESKSTYKKLDKLILENPSSPEKSGNYVPPADTPTVEPEPSVPSEPTTPTEPDQPDTPVTPDTPDPASETPPKTAER